MNLLPIVILFIILVILVLVLLLVFLCKNRSSFTLTPQWDSTVSFNKTNYVSLGNLITYVYDLYAKSLSSLVKTPNVAAELQKNFGLVETTILTDLDFVFKNPLTGTSDMGTQSIAAIMGKIQGTSMGVIVFRGTQNVPEWLTNLNSAFETVDLAKFLPDGKQVGEISGLPGTTPTQFEANTVVANGWLDLYCRIQGAPTKNGCLCEGPCGAAFQDKSFDNCIVQKPGKFSILDVECKPLKCVRGSCDKCINKISTAPSLAQDIYNGVKALQQKGVQSFIVTGHSLGGSMATLCSYHLAKAFGASIIHSVYTFASPMVGNQTFVDDYNKLVPHCYRIANSKDIVAKIPSCPANIVDKNATVLCPDFLKMYKAVGNTHYIFDYTEPGWGEGDYHSMPKDYLAGAGGLAKLFPGK
jgi:hypothetical protein